MSTVAAVTAATAGAMNGASAARCCLQLRVTRGPHAGVTLVLCRANAAASATSRLAAIGRKKQCELRLFKDLEVSGVHSELRLSRPEVSDVAKHPAEGVVAAEDESKPLLSVAVRDVGSTNGSKLNGQPLDAHVDYPLSDGDLVGVGRTSIRCRIVAHQDETAPSEPAIDDNKPVEVSADRDEKVDNADSETPMSTKCGDEASEIIHTSAEPVAVAELPSVPPETEDVQVLEHDDEVFETAPPRLPAQNTAADSRKVTCMVCGRWIGQLDVLEQQFHINACLDGRMTIPDTTLDETIGSARPASSKRHKRRAAAAASDHEKAQLTFAMALSMSVADKEQQVGMKVALVRRELEQVDAQMAKLAKKRASLVKSLQRMEKKAARVRKSRVLSPTEVRALLQLERALDVLFPSERRFAERNGAKTRKRKRAPSGTKSNEASDGVQDGGDSALDRVSMWVRASQQLFGQTERQMYYNSIITAYLPSDEQGAEPLERQDDHGNATEASIHEVALRTDDELGSDAAWWRTDDVPEAVKRTFPNWQRDFDFLEQRDSVELAEAIEELVRTRQDGHLALLSQREPEGEADTENEGDSLNHGQRRREQEEACLFMERVMRQLLEVKKKKESLLTSQQSGDPRPSGSESNDLVSLFEDGAAALNEESKGADGLDLQTGPHWRILDGEYVHRGVLSSDTVISIAGSSESDVDEDMGSVDDDDDSPPLVIDLVGDREDEVENTTSSANDPVVGSESSIETPSVLPNPTEGEEGVVNNDSQGDNSEDSTSQPCSTASSTGEDDDEDEAMNLPTQVERSDPVHTSAVPSPISVESTQVDEDASAGIGKLDDSDPHSQKLACALDVQPEDGHAGDATRDFKAQASA